MTVTSSSPRSSSKAPYRAASPATLWSPSGRAVLSKPGWVGVSTRLRPLFASSSANAATDWGPAPPCRSRKGWPWPRSSTVSSMGPILATSRVLVLEPGVVIMGVILFARRLSPLGEHLSGLVDVLAG